MSHLSPRIRAFPRLGRTIALTASAWVTGAFASSAAACPVQNLTALFDTPEPEEIAAVRADWALRVPTVSGFQLEAQGMDSTGALYDVISHMVDGHRHYAGVRYPRNYTPGQPHAALVVCHGGLGGVVLEEASNFLTVLPGQCVDDEYFLIIPSFRGEFLGTLFAGTFVSGGTPSPADRDVDDTRSLLSTVLVNYADIDHARIGAWGISRGGAVALLLSERDERIRRLVDMFGFTDLSLPSVQAEVDLILNAGATPSGIGRVVWEASVEPWLTGTLTLADARLAWIRRSPCYFARDLPPIQAHHGLQDVQVDASHTGVLLDALAALGASQTNAQGYFYPNGSHGLNSLPGHGNRVEPFLCEMQIGPRGYCGPMTRHSGGIFASADYRGSASVSRNDLVFRANNCPENGVGLVFVAGGKTYSPSGAGFLCVGLGARRLGVGLIDGAGTFVLPVDLATANPLHAQFFGVGSSVYFQVVFRDLGNPAGAWNFSNGLHVALQP